MDFRHIFFNLNFMKDFKFFLSFQIFEITAYFSWLTMMSILDQNIFFDCDSCICYSNFNELYSVNESLNLYYYWIKENMLNIMWFFNKIKLYIYFV